MEEVYTPRNKEKYIGINFPVARSGWEARAFDEIDNNPMIIRWASELIKIPYHFELDDRRHTYYTDIYLETFIRGVLTKFIIEIKPFNELMPPKRPLRQNYKANINYNKRLMTYKKNMNKWDFASRWAMANGMQFRIMTEKGFHIYQNGTIIMERARNNF